MTALPWAGGETMTRQRSMRNRILLEFAGAKITRRSPCNAAGCAFGGDSEEKDEHGDGCGATNQAARPSGII
jgi:hypothetical protein